MLEQQRLVLNCLFPNGYTCTAHAQLGPAHTPYTLHPRPMAIFVVLLVDFVRLICGLKIYERFWPALACLYYYKVSLSLSPFACSVLLFKHRQGRWAGRHAKGKKTCQRQGQPARKKKV